MTTDNTDKLYDHHRQQLSAMMDGALSPDEARFLLRRLQHDTELAACWERWQVSGDVLRAHARGGLHAALLPADFSQRVAKVIAGDSAAAAATATATRSRMVRWAGGGALAASVAAVALFIARQTPQALDAPATEPAQVVAASSSIPAPQVPIRPPQSPSAAASLATAVAVAQVPRHASARRTSRAQSQRAAIRLRASQDTLAASSGLAVASAPAAMDARPATQADPFGTQPIAPGRPWPRPLLPSARAVGGLTVDYGRVDTQPVNPFEPRALEATQPSPGDSAPH